MAGQANDGYAMKEPPAAVTAAIPAPAPIAQPPRPHAHTALRLDG